MGATLVVLISGSGTNLQALLDAVQQGRLDARIAAVISNRAGAFGLERARTAGIPVHVHSLREYGKDPANRRRYDRDLADRVAAYAPDWIVLAGWMHILSDSFLGRFPDRVINLHPALPGQFPGTHAIRRAYEAYRAGQITCGGIMVHLVPDERVDEGPVLATVEVPLHQDDTPESFEARVHAAEHELLVRVLVDLTGS